MVQTPEVRLPYMCVCVCGDLTNSQVNNLVLALIKTMFGYLFINTIHIKLAEIVYSFYRFIVDLLCNLCAINFFQLEIALRFHRVLQRSG